MANEAVNCPIHGTHGNLSQGKCWWCVQAGTISAGPSHPLKRQITVRPLAGTKRKIG